MNKDFELFLKKKKKKKLHKNLNMKKKINSIFRKVKILITRSAFGSRGLHLPGPRPVSGQTDER